MILLGLGPWLIAAAFIAWDSRWPAALLFEKALGYYSDAECWQRDYLREQHTGAGLIALANRDACIRKGRELARKALRRMEWRLL